MATSIDQKNFVKTALRLPPELHATVHEAAQKNGRSYNAELLERIQGSFSASASDAVVLDQARQIWQLRGKVMQSSFVMAQALNVLRGKDDDAADAMKALEEAINATKDDAHDFLKKLIQEQAERTGDLEYNFVKEYFDEARSKRSKPKA